ncbi:thioredoxin family protein [Bremerella sp. P1]|uniref:thioredoxin family protein n=1 Tax=Bremerella sp. P1 TaxID=3026424 RepID=UPI002367C7C5|nr:thioredoxin family protein [Bremerella sp. P1]WDI42393.1 thioredoxin family protein [Bremerella sp. P1]
MSFDPEYHEDAPTKEDIGQTTGKVVLDFGANWCPYCQEVSPALHSLLSEADNVQHIRVADGKGKPLGRSYRVKLWPTLVLLKDGKPVAQLVRPSADTATRELAAFLEP